MHVAIGRCLILEVMSMCMSPIAGLLHHLALLGDDPGNYKVID